jgi:hypothetical protein
VNEDDEKKPREIKIFVNDKVIFFDTQQVTGAQIKSKASVPSDSILYELHGENRIPIGNDEQIKIHENEKFLDVLGGNVS